MTAREHPWEQNGLPLMVNIEIEGSISPASFNGQLSDY